MIAVSRCLIGENCTYAGKNNLCKEIKKLYDQGLVLPLCPEVLGGLPIPRTPCEVIGEKVIDQKGIDRTKEYTQGAKIALDKCLEKNIKIAVLKAKSPSCGKNHTWFTKIIITTRSKHIGGCIGGGIIYYKFGTE